MNDPRETFYNKAVKLTELANKNLLEIAYKNNIGFHELVQFYSKASDSQITQLEYYLKTKQIPQVINLIELVTGTRIILPDSQK